MTIRFPEQRTVGQDPTIVHTRPIVVRQTSDRDVIVRPQVRIGPLLVDDLSQAMAVDAILEGARSVARKRAWIGYALHVGGLNERNDADYVQAMAKADCVYADGMSVVMLARLAGGRRVERTSTTDIGSDVLRRMGDELGRPVRVALVGGPDGLARAALDVLEAEAGVVGVAAEHGYHDDWTPLLARLALSECDVLLVGLGAPNEMKWVERHRDRLPPCVVLTCGGWFGFLVEEEIRAPRWMRQAGLEWAFRLAQAPRRLARRYAVGLVSTSGFAVLLCLQRVFAPAAISDRRDYATAASSGPPRS